MPQVSPLQNVQPEQLVPPVQTDPLGQPPTASVPQTAGAPQVPTPQAPPLAAPAPVTLGFDPARDTVEGRVAGIVGQGGPLQRVGETKALQQAQQRGLLNTSMAVGATQKANIESALPIAQQDAGFFQQQALQTQKAEIDKQLLTASADEQVRLILEKGKVDTAIQELRGTQATGQILTAGEVESNLVSDRHASAQEILRLQEETESRLTTQRADISKQLLTAEGDQKEALLNQQGQLDLAMAVEKGNIASQLQAELFEINKQMATASYEHTAALTELKAGIETQLQGLIGSQALEQQGLRGDQAMELATIEKEYDVLINTQHSAAAVFGDSSNAIGAILANPDIPTEAKPGLISQQMTLLFRSLAVMGGITDMDLTGLLNFGTTSPGATPSPGAPDVAVPDLGPPIGYDPPPAPPKPPKPPKPPEWDGYPFSQR